MGDYTGHAISPQKKNIVTFKSLGVVDILCEACKQLKWEVPTAIQQEALPVAFAGKDVIGLAETGSGKTGAFALPILQQLLKDPQRMYALILVPTRELAFQISEQFTALGATVGLMTVVIIGGIDMITQARDLAKKPHIIIATPGRLIDHLENTKGFNLKALKFLVLDEADRMLDLDFEDDVDKILKAVPSKRTTYLYSATMTEKVQKLQRASLTDPVKVEVSKKYQTVETLEQYYVFLPAKHKDIYLVHILNELANNSFIVFCTTCDNAQNTFVMLRYLGLAAISLHGKLNQSKRLAALTKFKSSRHSILIATDVASRGLDIPNVDVVINFDIPTHTKDYIHRVGRTARAGRAGKAITFVTQFDIERYLRIELLIEKKLSLYPAEHDNVMVLKERVKEAQRHVKLKQEEKGNKRLIAVEDDSHETKSSRNRMKKITKHKGNKRIRAEFV